MDIIYLDHNATTPVDPEVVDAMLPYLHEKFGNASSVHHFGREAKVALENAREQIAAMINCEPAELYFTSGGTESDNLAIFGTTYQQKKKGKNHLIVGTTEHHAVIEPAEHLHHNEGWDLDLLPVDGEGFSSPEALAKLLRDDTAIVSVMHGNNETGVIQPIKELAAVTKARKVLFHTDAVQSIGKVKVDVRDLGVDMASLTGHKIYGQKGTGAIYIRAGVKISPLFYGGSHEKKRRPGTENVAGAVGLAKALEVAEKRADEDHKKLTELSSYFIEAVLDKIPDVKFNGPRDGRRIPQTMNFAFTGIEGESIVLALDLKQIAVSSGSACTSGAVEPSHVLTAMGIPALSAQGSVRFSMGRSTTKQQLDYVLTELPPIIERLREMSPVYKRAQQPS